MSRAAIYARFSTDLQSDRSIDDQVSLCKAHARRLGATVAKVYSDRAMTSASLIGRDGILSLMEDARAGAFDLVIVEALDRISRDQGDLAGIFKRLRFAGVEIEEVHGGRASTMSVGLRGLMGELFLADLKDKVRRGMAGNVDRGKSPGGRAYGYRPVAGAPGELAIDATEAGIVRRIFGEYADGRVPRDIAADLNRDGVLPPRGAHWSASAINGNRKRGHGILLNPLYDGRLVWNRVRMVRDPDTGKRISRPNPPADWRETPAEELRIVPADLYAAVQARRARAGSEARTKSRRPSRIFSGLLKCGVCGGGMGIHDRRGGAVRIRCTTARESGSCSNGGKYRLDRIERQVIERVREGMRDPAVIRAYVEEYNAERRRLARDAVKHYAKIDRRLERAKAEYDRAFMMYCKEITDGPEAEANIRRLQIEIETIRAELETTVEPPSFVELHPGALKHYEAALDEMALALSSDDPEDQDLVASFRQLFARVTVTPGEDRSAIIQVEGCIAGLTTDPDRAWGCSVVAEGRFLLTPPFALAG